MALLRLSDGRNYTGHEEINELVAPLSVGRFTLPDSVRERVARSSAPLSPQDALFVFQNLDPKVVGMAQAEGFKYRRIGNVVPLSSGERGFAFCQRDERRLDKLSTSHKPLEALAEFLIPHHGTGNEWHFVFSGAIIKGVRIADDLQGVVYFLPGDWIRVNPKVLGWRIYPSGQQTIAISYYDRPFDEPFPVQFHPEITLMPGMMN